MKKEICVLLFCLFCLLSCSTMSGFNQRVKLTSFPDGAKVYDGGQLLGQTPGYFYVRRGLDADLLLKKNGYEDTELDLDSSYRWKRSFLANGIWLLYAPVGWAVDLATGTAFDYDKVDPSDYPKLKRVGGQDKVEDQKFEIAIAPPISSHELMSDEIGKNLYRDLSNKFPKAKVVPYRKSEVTFASYNSTNSSYVHEDFEDDMYEDLGVTHVAKAKVSQDQENVEASVTVSNIFMERDDASFKKRYDSKSFLSLSQGGVLKNILQSVSFIPNSLALDVGFNTDEQSFSVSDNSISDYQAAQKSKDSTLDYLTGISAKNIVNSRVRTRFDFIFRFAPRYSLIFKRSKFERLGGGELHDSTLARLGISVGLGPEIGVETPFGYTNSVVSAVVKYENLTMKRSDGVKGSESDFSIVPDVEFGHGFFVTRDINLRLFLGLTYHSRDALSNTVAKVSSSSVTSDDNLTSRAGFTIGYFFPQGKSYIKRLFY